MVSPPSKTAIVELVMCTVTLSIARGLVKAMSETTSILAWSQIAPSSSSKSLAVTGPGVGLGEMDGTVLTVGIDEGRFASPPPQSQHMSFAVKSVSSKVAQNASEAAT